MAYWVRNNYDLAQCIDQLQCKCAAGEINDVSKIQINNCIISFKTPASRTDMRELFAYLKTLRLDDDTMLLPLLSAVYRWLAAHRIPYEISYRWNRDISVKSNVAEWFAVRRIKKQIKPQ